MVCALMLVFHAGILLQLQFSARLVALKMGQFDQVCHVMPSLVCLPHSVYYKTRCTGIVASVAAVFIVCWLSVNMETSPALLAADVTVRWHLPLPTF